jgi:hypothetical protein
MKNHLRSMNRAITDRALLVESLKEKRRIMNFLFTNQEKLSPTGETDPHLA